MSYTVRIEDEQHTTTVYQWTDYDAASAREAVDHMLRVYGADAIRGWPGEPLVCEAWADGGSDATDDNDGVVFNDGDLSEDEQIGRLEEASA